MRDISSASFVFVSSGPQDHLSRMERRLLAVIGELRRLHAAVHVICLSDSPFAQASSSLGATVAPYRLERFNVIRTRSRVRKYLRRYEPAVVESTGSYADLIVRSAAKGLPVAVVNSVHCAGWPPQGPTRLSTRALRRYDIRWLDRVDTVLVDCLDLIERMKAVGAPADKLVYDPPSVDLSRVRSHKRVELAVAGDSRTIVGYAGSLAEGRGLDVLAAAAKILAERQANVRVVVAGVGRVPGGLGRLAAAGYVELLGEVPSLPGVLAAYDLCVFPSLASGAPTPLLEAVALGRPVVATSVPGIEGLFADGEEITLVPPGDAEALADAIEAVVDDPTRAAVLADRARMRTVDEYSLASSVVRHIVLYRDVMGRAGQRAQSSW